MSELSNADFSGLNALGPDAPRPRICPEAGELHLACPARQPGPGCGGGTIQHIEGLTMISQ